MPSLAGAITRQTAIGVAGPPAAAFFSDVGSGRPDAGTFTQVGPTGVAGRLYGDFAKTVATFSRPDDGTFTQVAPSGVAGRLYGSFAGRVESFEDTKYVTDRYVPVLTFDPVSDVDLDVTDVYVPVLRMSSYAGIGVTVSDTYVPRVTLGVGSLQKSSVSFTANVTDSYVPVLDMTAALVYSTTVTDSYVPVLTFSTPTVAKIPIAEVTDTYVPVLSMEYSLDAIIGAVTHYPTDVYVPVLVMNAAAAQAGEVDDIHIYERPYGLIRIVET